MNMGILTETNEDKKTEISTVQTVFTGRLASGKLTMSTRSLLPTDYYQLIFEDSIKTIKGTVPISNECNYHQTGKDGKSIGTDGLMESMSVPKEPQSNQFLCISI